MTSFRLQLTEKGLKVTPQRLAIMDAIEKLNNHPRAEQIIQILQKTQPNISVGTIYKVLETFVDHHLLRKVNTENNVMRYEPVMQHHHHLYCAKSDKIEDYCDTELDELLAQYFQKKHIKNFNIKEIKLQISGEFKPSKTSK